MEMWHLGMPLSVMKMNVVIITSVFLSSFSCSIQQDFLKGKFKFLISFAKLLPAHNGAYLVPTFQSTLFGCTGKCLQCARCERFLFDSISKECGLLRCPLHGLKTITSTSAWRDFNSINSK